MRWLLNLLRIKPVFERRPTLREELPPEWNRLARRTLAEQNDLDRRIAGAVVKRWRKKGLL